MDVLRTSAPAGNAALDLNARGRVWRDPLVIGLVALCLHLLGNDRVSLWDRDEPRYAGCTREMRASGDWLHPTFNAEPRYHKPILTYWLMAGAMSVAGETTFGARLISVLAGTGTCLLVWGLGRRLFGARVGLWAGLMAATAPILVYNSKSATTDALLTFFLFIAWWALWELSNQSSRRWALTFWVALALATLTKGPVGVGLVLASALVARVWGLRFDWLRRLQWRWGPLVFLAIAAPWFIAIAFISKGRFYEVAMGRHVIHRMTNPMEEHGGFPGFYLVMTLFVMFPWSAFLPPALLSGWRERRSVPAVGFLAGWILGPLIMLELVRTKLIHYDMPAMPPMVLFAAWWLDRVAESQLNVRRWALGRFAAGLLCAVGMAIVVVVAAVAWRGPAELRAPSILLALIAAAGGLWSMERYWSGATEAATRALLATSALGLATCFGWFFPALEPHRLTQNTARRLSELSNENRALAMLAEFKPPGMVWEMGRPVPLIESRAELRRQVTQGGPVVTAVTEDGWRLFSRDPSFEVSELDRTRGLDLERGRFSEVRLIKITAREPASVARGAEKSNVK